MSTRISAAVASKLLSKRPEQLRSAPKGSKNKYGAVTTRFGDDVFDSRRECHRFIELRRMADAGLITDLERQVVYRLTVAGVFIGKIVPDFRYRRGGELVVEDVKSKPTMTPIFRWKVKHLLAEHGIKLEVVQ